MATQRPYKSPDQLKTIKGKNKALWLNEGRIICHYGGIGRHEGLWQKVEVNLKSLPDKFLLIYRRYK